MRKSMLTPRVTPCEAFSASEAAAFEILAPAHLFQPLMSSCLPVLGRICLITRYAMCSRYRLGRVFRNAFSSLFSSLHTLHLAFPRLSFDFRVRSPPVRFRLSRPVHACSFLSERQQQQQLGSGLVYTTIAPPLSAVSSDALPEHARAGLHTVPLLVCICSMSLFRMHTSHMPVCSYRIESSSTISPTLVRTTSDKPCSWQRIRHPCTQSQRLRPASLGVRYQRLEALAN